MAEKCLAYRLAWRWKREYSEMCGYIRMHMSIEVVRANTLMWRGSRTWRRAHSGFIENGRAMDDPNSTSDYDKEAVQAQLKRTAMIYDQDERSAIRDSRSHTFCRATMNQLPNSVGQEAVFLSVECVLFEPRFPLLQLKSAKRESLCRQQHKWKRQFGTATFSLITACGRKCLELHTTMIIGREGLARGTRCYAKSPTIRATISNRLQ